MTLNKTFFQVSMWALGILSAANIFFIKRLISELDETKEIVWALRQEVVVMKYAIDHKTMCKKGE
jgi:hypothetical protein